MIFYQLYCGKCYLFFITKTQKELCPICGRLMFANFNKGIKMDIDIQRKMKIYLAASHPRKEEIIKLAQQLEERNFEIVSFWHLEDKPDYRSGERAMRDQSAIQQCDLFVELIGDDMSKGGRHCELGIALAWNKKIILIGDSENEFCVFTNLPWLPKMKTIEEFLRKIS